LKEIPCTVHFVVAAKYSLSALSEQCRDDAIGKSTGRGGGLGKPMMQNHSKLLACKGGPLAFAISSAPRVVACLLKPNPVVNIHKNQHGQ